MQLAFVALLLWVVGLGTAYLHSKDGPPHRVAEDVGTSGADLWQSSAIGTDDLQQGIALVLSQRSYVRGRHRHGMHLLLESKCQI